MSRRGFTLIELVIASTISAVILASLCMALTSVWRTAKDTNDVLQLMLKASALRDKLLVGTAGADENGFHGLLNITNEVAVADEGRTLSVIGGVNAEYDSLPNPKGGPNFPFRKEEHTDKWCVSVSNLPPLSVKIAGKSYTEDRQRVCVYLWVETSTGTKCRMPVSMTIGRNLKTVTGGAP